MNVVSVMAHRDDEMRCLGTMLKCRARGDRLAFVTVTDGAKGFVQNPALVPEEAATIRDAEMRSLATAIDAEYLNLREPDEFLYDLSDFRTRLIEAIRQTRPDLLITHNTDDYNVDHTTVCLLVRHCAMQACLPCCRRRPLPSNPSRRSSWSSRTAPLSSRPRITSTSATSTTRRSVCCRTMRRGRRRCGRPPARGSAR